VLVVVVKRERRRGGVVFVIGSAFLTSGASSRVLARERATLSWRD
jgi:hypothetical protein